LQTACFVNQFTLAGKRTVTYVKSILGFTIGGLIIVAMFLAVEFYIAENTYRGTPPLGNLIFGIVLFSPSVLCGSLGFALGLRLFGAVARIFRAALVGAIFVVAIGLLVWGVNRIVRFNPFEYSMVTEGVVVFVFAVPFALLARVLMRANVEARAS
jgi:hypothetical protein